MPPATPDQQSATSTPLQDLLNAGWSTTEQLARLLNVDPSTMRRWRTARPPQGPPFVRLSERVVLYSNHDVEQWLRRHRTVPQGER
ncbi:putative DNA-binding transcriptional regulator AlpA [Streptomyces sp. V3I8]|uniref:helix-turn-helix transcriptional regulator n=1 Tax=Streptomyces sp. V3I8 TaxID=3042279 RepID=UPI002789A6CB|nr:helix-turn-helix domain-containing protein [Streptomyces sp. V3I8]MDQ1034861.1 putative DNA-binding transcriptional regulator AlpA [Streptomyces sp. V3I8]